MSREHGRMLHRRAPAELAFPLPAEITALSPFLPRRLVKGHLNVAAVCVPPALARFAHNSFGC